MQRDQVHTLIQYINLYMGTIMTHAWAFYEETGERTSRLLRSLPPRQWTKSEALGTVQRSLTLSRCFQKKL